MRLTDGERDGRGSGHFLFGGDELSRALDVGFWKFCISMGDRGSGLGLVLARALLRLGSASPVEGIVVLCLCCFDVLLGSLCDSDLLYSVGAIPPMEPLGVPFS